uniref:Uncharacterized protein n=1 Tax=viral metagenome TaxID=1070528 RepID=A0A6C0KWX0_9ZZZZ|tara:strand:- start:5563 stop:5982 length:420 start_codon:yes stop_codon:yes gene_type:complete
MKKQENRKRPRKTLKKKHLKKTTKNLLKNNKSKKYKKSGKARKSFKNKSRSRFRRRNTKVLKGGAIPFSELNPSLVLEHTMHDVKGMLSGSLIDTAQTVPNNLSHNVNPSVMSQPYLDGNVGGSLNVAGDSPEVLFATP